jgi:hypothetical protein
MSRGGSILWPLFDRGDGGFGWERAAIARRLARLLDADPEAVIPVRGA